jgi:hypothetical protein
LVARHPNDEEFLHWLLTAAPTALSRSVRVRLLRLMARAKKEYEAGWEPVLQTEGEVLHPIANLRRRMALPWHVRILKRDATSS